jgi:hypothetical protein
MLDLTTKSAMSSVPTLYDPGIVQQDVHILSAAARMFDRLGDTHLDGLIFRGYLSTYGASIPHPSLRPALCALICYWISPDQEFKMFSYTENAYHSLKCRLKKPAIIDEGDLFALGILAFVEHGNYGDWVVHYNGFLSLLKHLLAMSKNNYSMYPLFNLWFLLKDTILSLVEEDTHVLSAYETNDVTIQHQLKYLLLSPERSIFFSFQMSGILRACRILRSEQANCVDVSSVIEIVRPKLGNPADERDTFEWLKEAVQGLVSSTNTEFGISKYTVFVALEALVHSRLARHFLASLDGNVGIAGLLAETSLSFSSIVSFLCDVLMRYEVPKHSSDNTFDGKIWYQIWLTVGANSLACAVRTEIIAAIAYVQKVWIYIEEL